MRYISKENVLTAGVTKDKSSISETSEVPSLRFVEGTDGAEIATKQLEDAGGPGFQELNRMSSFSAGTMTRSG